MFLYFILGILFTAFILPILDSFSSLIISLIEISKGKAALKIATYNKKIEELKLNSSKEDDQMRQIGFAIDEIQELEEDDEDEDDY